MRIVLMGLAGSGKGTLARELVAKVNGKFGSKIPHLSTGDIFRDILKRDDQLAADLRQYVSTGRLVPDDVTCRVVEDRLSRADCAGGFLLDGFPRNLAQAEWLKRHMSESGESLDLALSLKVDPEVSLKRLLGRTQCGDCGQGYNTFFSPPRSEGVCDLCGGPLDRRADDDEAIIRKRISDDAERVASLEKFYADCGILEKVDADRTPEEVANGAWQQVEDVGAGR